MNVPTAPTRLALLTLLIWLTPLTAAFANMANPWEAGDPVGEPIGAFKHLAITHEVLNLDLRPLDSGEDVRISATYTIENSGDAVDVDLFFVAPGLEHGEVRLDGTAVSARKEERPLPEAWTQPGQREAAGLLFQVRLDPGSHTIAVSYAASASEDHMGSIHRAFVVDYVLAPARAWASFGTLEVNVQTPSGWDVTAEPELKLQGRKLLQATFQGLPADRLTLRAHKSTGWRGFVATGFTPLCLILSLVLVVWLGWRRSDWIAGRSKGATSLITLGLVMLSCVGSAVIWCGGIWISLMIVEDHLISRTWSYGMGVYLFLSIVAGPVAGVFGFTLGGVGRWMRSGSAGAQP